MAGITLAPLFAATVVAVAVGAVVAVRVVCGVLSNGSTAAVAASVLAL